MTDSLDRATASARLAGGAFSQKLMPGVNKALDVFSGFMAKLTRWMELAPNLTRWIGYLVVAALRAIFLLLDSIILPFRMLADELIWLGQKIGILDEEFGKMPELPESMATVIPEALASTQSLNAAEGGLKREFSNLQTNNRTSDNSTHIGEQHIHVEQQLSSNDLRDAWALGV